MTYRAVFGAIASSSSPVSPINYVVDQGAKWSGNTTTIGRARSVPKTYLMEGVSSIAGITPSVQFEGTSAFFTLPSEISTTGLIIKGPPSLPHKIFVNGVESNIVVAGATIEIRANNKSDITQSEYPITVGLNTVIAYADTTPNAFTVPDMFGCAIGNEYTTETITPTGFDNAVVSGTGYALINGIRAALPATILEGSTVAFIFTQVQLEDSHTVSIGTASTTFTSFRDKPAVLTPISLFHIAYARSGVKYTSGLIRNDTGQEVDITVTNGVVVGGKTKLGDQETCELEFVVPAGVGHHAVTLSSGKTSVVWHVWKDDTYLDPWVTVAGPAGTKTESVPLSFASLPKPAKMSVYFPSGVDAKINGVDINPDETYAGLDASSTEVEITTNDEVIISGYPNFAAKRVRVGSVYATWLLFPEGGDPTCSLPYYPPAYLPDSIPIRLNSVTYSTVNAHALHTRSDTGAATVGTTSLRSAQPLYIGELAPVLAAGFNQTLLAPEVRHVTARTEHSTAPNVAYKEHNLSHGVPNVPRHVAQYLERLPLAVLEYRHQNCEVVDAVTPKHVDPNFSATAGGRPRHVKEPEIQYAVAVADAKYSVPMLTGLSDGRHIQANAIQTLVPNGVHAEPQCVQSDALVPESAHVAPLAAPVVAPASYGAAFVADTADGVSAPTPTHVVESSGQNRGTVYSHVAGTLEIGFVEAARIYSVPMLSLSATDVQHSINLVSHWSTPAHSSVQGKPIAVGFGAYTFSTSAVYNDAGGQVFDSTPLQHQDVVYHVAPAATNLRDSHNGWLPVVEYKQEHYVEVQSKSRLISKACNKVGLVSSFTTDVTHTIDSRAQNTPEFVAFGIHVGALRTQAIHPVYLPDFMAFESFYVDESAPDTAHGYFQTNVAAMSNGMRVWRKQPYEIAPYEVQDNVWVWITPVYGFNLCSSVPVLGYIRGG